MSLTSVLSLVLVVSVGAVGAVLEATGADRVEVVCVEPRVEPARVEVVEDWVSGTHGGDAVARAGERGREGWVRWVVRQCVYMALCAAQLDRYTDIHNVSTHLCLCER